METWCNYNIKVSEHTNPNEIMQQIYTSGLTWNNDEPKIIIIFPLNIPKYKKKAKWILINKIK